MNLTASTPPKQVAAYLRTLPSIRERCTRVFDLAKQGKLQYFNYHPDKEPDLTAFCVDIIKVRLFLHLAVEIFLIQVAARLWN